MNFMWKIVNATMQGTSHIKNGVPCQDFVKSSAYAVKIIALADGAGSATHSDIGAKFACEAIINNIERRFNKLYETDLPLLKKRLVNSVMLRLYNSAKKKKVDISQFGSTLLFIAIQGNRVLAGHIGDGVIGAISNDGKISVLSEPERGEYANTTFFTTSSDSKSHFRIYKFKVDDYKSFFLMSDGAADCLYLRSEQQFSNAITKISKWMEDNDISEINEAISDNMRNYFPSKTSDDCSFIMIQKFEA